MWRKIVLAVAVIVFCISAFQLFRIFREYQKADTEYKELEKEVVTIVKPEKEDVEQEETVVVDFEKLRKINEEVVAWIRFENPEEINYPVLYSGDNYKYLSETFEGTPSTSGAIFIDQANEENFTNRNTFLYGHNMKNGAMFGKLDEYKKEEFWKVNQYFSIYLPDGSEHIYQVFAVEIVEDTSDSYQFFYENDNDFLSYIKKICKRSLYDTEVSVYAEQRIVSLSTCTNVTETERMLVHGVEVEVRDAN